MYALCAIVFFYQIVISSQLTFFSRGARRHFVELAPSRSPRFAMYRAQWLTCSVSNPSTLISMDPSAQHPVVWHSFVSCTFLAQPSWLCRFMLCKHTDKVFLILYLDRSSSTCTFVPLFSKPTCAFSSPSFVHILTTVTSTVSFYVRKLEWLLTSML